MRRVLVTGGGGFIGRHVLEPLRARGFEVCAPRSTDVDLLAPEGPRRAIEYARPSHLLHLAWYAEHGRFWASEENMRWVEASLRLLRAFAAAGGSRAVMAGTCAEYDWTASEDLLHEDRSALRPATLYGAAKHALHVVAAPWAEKMGVSLAWGRIFFAHGPGEAPERLVASVARALVAGTPAETSSGTQVLDVLHVMDIAAAFATLVDSDATGPVNIASGQGRSVRAIVEALGAAAGRPDLLRIGALTDRSGDPPRLVGNTTRLRDDVGWHPTLSFEDGLAASFAWWRAQAPRR